MKIEELIPHITEVVPYTYEHAEGSVFEEIINNFLKEVPSSTAPTLVHMLGIPAAGKSTFYHNNAEMFKGYLFVSFDAIMEALPQYQQDVEQLGSVEAFRRWELPARIAGYELLRRAVASNKNIFLDHSAAPKCHQELLKNAKKLGYKTKMFYIYCPVEVAKERVRQRELITKRHTPLNLITERAELIEKNKVIYQSIVDEFVCIR